MWVKDDRTYLFLLLISPNHHQALTDDGTFQALSWLLYNDFMTGGQWENRYAYVFLHSHGNIVPPILVDVYLQGLWVQLLLASEMSLND